MSDRLSSHRNSRALWLLATAIVVALIFAGSAMTQTSQKKAPVKKNVTVTTYTVTITPGKTWDDPPSVDKTSVTVDKAKGDEVQWVCPTCTAGFDVLFIESGKKPFKNRSFNKGKNKSGKATGDAGTYPYKVIVGGGVLDPDVIIR
jgi:hypothetical protein